MRELWQANNNGWSVDTDIDWVVDIAIDVVVDTDRVLDTDTANNCRYGQAKQLIFIYSRWTCALIAFCLASRNKLPQKYCQLELMAKK